MKTKDGFQQCYNAQAAVEVESMLVVANDLSNQGNDKGQLVPMVEKAKASHALSAIPDEGYGKNRRRVESGVLLLQSQTTLLPAGLPLGLVQRPRGSKNSVIALKGHCFP